MSDQDHHVMTLRQWVEEYYTLRAEVEQLRSDLELRNQTACDRKEIIQKLEAEIEKLRIENAALRRSLELKPRSEGHEQ